MQTKTTAIVAVVALAALMVAPMASAQGTMNVRSFWDVGAGFTTGAGAGLYNPTGPVYCAALGELYVGVLPVLFYYLTPVRWQPAVAASVHHLTNVQSPPLPAPLSTCLTLDPAGGHVLRVDYLQVDAGSMWWNLNVLGASQVANLGATTVTLEYCSNPAAAVQGTAGVGGVAYTAVKVDTCNGGAASYQLYPGCPEFTMSTAVGSLNGDQPVFLVDGASCNTHVNSGQSLQAAPGAGVTVGVAALAVTGADYEVEVCVSTDVTDTNNGNVYNGVADSDHFVTGHNGDLLAWSTASDPLGSGFLFTNVGNLTPDDPSARC